MRIKVHKEWSTYLPMLIKCVQATDGPVMELGAGVFSTPLLHWLCEEKGRKLVTYENVEKFYVFAKCYESKTHVVQKVDNYDEIDTESHWSVVLVDHDATRRMMDTIRLKRSADYLILHDTHHEVYRYRHVWHHFKYIYHWKFCKPWTSVVSNFCEVDPNWGK